MKNLILERIQLSRDYRETFESPHGKRVLLHLLKISGATAPRFTTDPQQLLWNEAQRHLALSIFRQARSSLDLPEYLEEELKRTEEQQKL